MNQLETKRKRQLALAALAILFPLVAISQEAPVKEPKAETKNDEGRYEKRKEHDPYGTGKFYMGREIAHVMGHFAADWLERPEREEEEAPSLLVESIGLKPDMVIADIGAGSGYLSFPIASKVGPKGKVFAVDIQPEMLRIIEERKKKRGITNVEAVKGSVRSANLPAGSVDLIIMVDVYHEFAFPYEMTKSMIDALKEKGRIVFVEYRLEDPSIPIKLVHKMSQKQVIKEMSVHPLRWVGTIDKLPRQHVIIFEKSVDAENKDAKTKEADVKTPASENP